MSADPRVDAFIAAAQPFARPILERLRAAIHAACPGATETIKWGRPNFEHKGRVFASLGAFKAHVSIMLWRMDRAGAALPEDADGANPLRRLTSVADLPPADELARLIAAATAVIDSGAPKPKGAPRATLPVPAELSAALAAAPAARATFEGFAPSHRRDYCEWIGEAKRPETRARRVAQAIAWLGEGKTRHWQYQR